MIHEIERKTGDDGECYKLVSHKKGICCHPSLYCLSTYSVIKTSEDNLTGREIRKSWIWCDEDSSEAYSIFKKAGDIEE
tara:strand:+ start:24 stop:260 length:237 start_codon:yes stop_codon:yes gene_type:complete